MGFIGKQHKSPCIKNPLYWRGTDKKRGRNFFAHFKPTFSHIIPIQFRYYEDIQNKLIFFRFLIVIKFQLGGNFAVFGGAKKLPSRFLPVPRQY